MFLCLLILFRISRQVYLQKIIHANIMGNRRIMLEVSLRNEKIRLHLKDKWKHVFAL